MKVFAIGDLHLGIAVDKPMDVFGDRWVGHSEKLKKQWEDTVSHEDLVIVCGDISWGMRLGDAMPDLKWLDQLPGKKVCIKGNHDYWWEKIGKLNTLFESVYFLQNKAYTIGDITICGTRGWQFPKDSEEDKEQQKIYEREAQRLELSLKDAKKQKAKRIIVALHYPPTNEKQEPSLYTEQIRQYPVTDVVYGHLHDQKAWALALKGEQEGIQFHLVAADYIDFTPKRIG